MLIFVEGFITSSVLILDLQNLVHRSMQILVLLSRNCVCHIFVIHCFFFFFSCRLLIIIGVILLVCSTRLLRHLPRPLRRFIQRGVDRNFSPRRSGSVRLRDTNPSAVIQAATLQHLISSPPKEKAWTVAYVSMLRFLLMGLKMTRSISMRSWLRLGCIVRSCSLVLEGM